MTGAVERYLRLKQEIADLARATGRAPDTVQLVAASKTQQAETLGSLIQAGLTDFGENTVQEALPKIERLRPMGPTWHFIGHLQSNKAKHIPGHFGWIHSLDSPSLALRLERIAAERDTILSALIEVNITGDPRKHGIVPDALEPLLESLLRDGLPHIHLRGLMTVGPYPANAADTRACFRALRQLRDTAESRFGLHEFDQLSMGMSEDYAHAIAEGATMVRIGSAIFGARTYAEA